jgi:hypothetical protein
MAQIVQIVVFGLSYISMLQHDTNVSDITAFPNHRTTTSPEHFGYERGYSSLNPEDGGRKSKKFYN